METAAPEPAQTAPCWSCAAKIESGDRYCRWCGRGQGDFLPWWYQPWGLAFLAVFFLGPFALPMVWRSPKLGKNGRMVMSVLILLYTGWVGLKLMDFNRALRSALENTGLGALQ